MEVKKRLAALVFLLAVAGAGCGSWQIGDPPPDRSGEPTGENCPPCTICWNAPDVNPCQPPGHAIYG